MCIGMHHGPQGPPGFPQHQHMQGPQPGQGPPQRGPPPGSMGGERLRSLMLQIITNHLLYYIRCTILREINLAEAAKCKMFQTIMNYNKQKKHAKSLYYAVNPLTHKVVLIVKVI